MEEPRWRYACDEQILCLIWQTFRCPCKDRLRVRVVICSSLPLQGFTQQSIRRPNCYPSHTPAVQTAELSSPRYFIHEKLRSPFSRAALDSMSLFKAGTACAVRKTALSVGHMPRLELCISTAINEFSLVMARFSWYTSLECLGAFFHTRSWNQQVSSDHLCPSWPDCITPQ